MDKKIIPILAVLFMVFIGFQFAEPAAAVKVVDHGTKYGWGLSKPTVLQPKNHRFLTAARMMHG